MSAACRRWRRRCWTLLLCAAIAAPVQAALRIEVAADGLSAQELQASRQLIEQVLVRLPTPVRDGQALALRLRWRDDLPSHVAGRARGSELGLDQRLLAALPGDGADASTPAWRRAQAALIHELAHALDRSVAGGWSHDARFLDLAGWQVRPLLPGRGRNRFLLRSPDRYELHSPAEFFAVNLEHYLLDADNACRRPALHRWFAAALGPLPAAAEATCASALPFVEAGAQDGMAGLLELDPARVYEVDYLLAEGNGQPMSRWGHSMLRLVVCAPGRAPGPACRMDLQYHRVLSFRAFVGDVQLSNWRGLTGSYPSRLFVLPLDRVVEDYTRVELRGLSSVPLRLRREEIAALLEQAARVHWTYDGRYYFVSNNCAVETWKLLHDGVPRLAGRRLSSITPVGLLRRLERGGDAVPVSPGDRAAAVRAGYYFESDAPRYRQLFEVVRAGLQPPVADVERWLELPPGERRRWMDADDERVLAALLVLEQAAWRRGELRVRDLLKRSLLARGGDAAALERVRGLLAQAGLLLAPGMLASEGYGLPLERERAVLRRDVAGRTQAAGDERRSLDAALRDLLPEAERARLLGVESNLDHLRQRLRYVSGTEAAGVDPVPRP
ncbi:DUF4105 domain-containing protein [Stenotrophomonas nitritireducens]|uniref:DUF7844 domain-containing protein n=1 Tax=Stenotrophomonas nitritireducens TaxID=83617 RepID=UPI0023540A2A|nr:DUF4105 domain-containing protein [Stenotrophomonas nitritireducens]